MKTNCIVFIIILVFCTNIVQAQFYVGPYVGFKSFGLKGASYISVNGQNSATTNTDASKTAFNFGLSAGVQVFPNNFAGGWYKLDVGLDASYSSIPFFETSYNYINGSGRYSADGFSEGGTTNLSFDIMPIHRLNIPNFQLLSPFAGVGLGMNLFTTSDLTYSQANAQAQNVKGNSEFKLGLLIFYGTVLRASDMIQPYIIFRHYAPFGSESQFTNDSQNGNIFIKDVPGYFSIAGGARFVFN